MSLVDEVRRVFYYDPGSGHLTWVDCPHPRFNKSMLRRRAGTPHRDGARQVRFLGKIYQEHVMIWLWVYGEFPDGEIDHKNMKKDDNRLDNLRDATHSQNGANRYAQSNNVLGIKGVSLRSNGKYSALVNKDGKKHWIGIYATAEEAAAAYPKRAIELFGEFARAS